jgi:hypothetical protein
VMVVQDGASDPENQARVFPHHRFHFQLGGIGKRRRVTQDGLLRARHSGPSKLEDSPGAKAFKNLFAQTSSELRGTVV